MTVCAGPLTTSAVSRVYAYAPTHTSRRGRSRSSSSSKLRGDTLRGGGELLLLECTGLDCTGRGRPTGIPTRSDQPAWCWGGWAASRETVEAQKLGSWEQSEDASFLSLLRADRRLRLDTIGYNGLHERGLSCKSCSWPGKRVERHVLSVNDDLPTPRHAPLRVCRTVRTSAGKPVMTALYEAGGIIAACETIRTRSPRPHGLQARGGSRRIVHLGGQRQRSNSFTAGLGRYRAGFIPILCARSDSSSFAISSSNQALYWFCTMYPRSLASALRVKTDSS